MQNKIFRIREVFMASRIIDDSSHHAQLRMTQLVMPLQGFPADATA
jgi:hypothetical protein